MDGSDKFKANLAPRWGQRQQQQQQPQQQSQQQQQQPTSQHDDQRPSPPSSAAAAADSQIDIARRFLNEYNVRTASREKKIAFLRSKNVAEEDIRELLDGPKDDEDVEVEEEDDHQVGETPVDATNAYSDDTQTGAVSRSWASATQSSSSSPLSTMAPIQRPPIVTYPEFLAKPDRPGPLVTKSRLVNTLCAVTGLSTVLYGASKFVISPMIESLTDARLELHETTSKKLDDMVSKLETTVSVIPPPPPKKASPSDTTATGNKLLLLAAADDDEDPSEMFHRDIGTQTSSNPRLIGDASKGHLDASASATETDAARLSQFTKRLASLKDDFRSQDRSLRDVETVLDLFRDELDGMAYGKGNDFVGGFDMYGNYKRSEPDDDIRKARDNIRRIKGVLLSTRNFPTR